MSLPLPSPNSIYKLCPSGKLIDSIVKSVGGFANEAGVIGSESDNALSTYLLIALTNNVYIIVHYLIQ